MLISVWMWLLNRMWNRQQNMQQKNIKQIKINKLNSIIIKI